MTTDVKSEPETNTTTSTVTLVKTDDKTVPEPTIDPAEQLFSKLDALMDAKIKAATDDLNKKIEEQNKVIQSKDKEITDLKKANANMALSSNFNKAGDGVVDYSSKDFDEIDWNPQAKSLLSTIDKKVFDLKESEKR